MSERVTQAELARRLGVSRQAINDLMTRDLLPRSSDGLIDIDIATTAIAANIHPTAKTTAALPKSEPAAPPEQKGISYHTAKTLREITEAQIAGIKLRTMQNELAPRAEVDRKLRAAVISAREFLLAEPPRLAILMEGSTALEREELLKVTFNEFLTRISNWSVSALDDAD